MQRIALILLLLLTGCGNADSQDPCTIGETADNSITTSYVPEVVVEPDSLSFDAAGSTRRLAITNVGNSCADILSVDFLAAPTRHAFRPGAEWFESAEIRPREQVELEVVWDGPNRDAKEAVLRLTTNAPRRPGGHVDVALLAAPD